MPTATAEPRAKRAYHNGTSVAEPQPNVRYIYYEPRGACRELHACRAPELIIAGCAGCVAGETELWDPVSLRGYRFDNLCERHIRPIVQTLNGPVLADVPFIKGIADLYRVTLANGHSCVVKLDHLFLSLSGWMLTSCLSPGMELLSASYEDVRHCSRTDQDYRDDYSVYRRRCGEQPLRESMGVLSFLTSQCDVRALDCAGLPRDVPASITEHNRPCLSNDHHSTPSSDLLLQDVPLDDWSEGYASRDVLCYASSSTFVRGLLSYPQRDLLSRGSLPLQPFSSPYCDYVRTRPQCHDVSSLCASCPDCLSACYSPYRSEWVPIISITFERTDVYYDLHVPIEEHYLANGIWSHNTGKSRACLEKANRLLDKYPGCRGLMIRKTRKSITQSCAVTFEQEVINYRPDVERYGGTNVQEWRYPNGSVFVPAGFDDPRKILSSFWDFAYVNQPEELTEEEWTLIGHRLRNFKMRRNGVPWTQLFGDPNPAEPDHWIQTRAAARDEKTGLPLMTLLESRHEDNPVYWDADKGVWTVEGALYIATLDRLFGVHKQRLRYGRWCAAEGAVYEDSWDRAIHVVPRILAYDTTVGPDLRLDQAPKSWPRYWAVDFGYKNPFTWAEFAEDPDGRLWRLKEIYMTGRIVEDHARTILLHTADDPKPKAIICDHDAEDRATLHRHLGQPITTDNIPANHPHADKLRSYCVDMRTVSAYKCVSPGIQAVEARLRVAGDGKPRIFYLQDSLIELDRDLLAKKLPTCTEAEYPVYVWSTTHGKRKGEEPEKMYDHAMDRDRYLVAYVDQVGKNTPKMFGMISVTKSGQAGAGSGGGLTQQSGFRMDGSSGMRSKWSNT